MGGHENLKVPTSEEARINGRKGGIRSGQARKQKKLMREMIQEMLNTKIKDKGTIRKLEELGFKDKNYQAAMIASVLAKALKGDVRANEFIRDTAGEKPQEQVQILEPPTIIDDI